MNSKEVIQEIRTLLGFSEEPKAEIEMASAMLVDGTEIQWEGELAVGVAIFVVTNEGLVPAPDATHEVEGGMLVTTEGGLVTEIVEPAEEVEIEVEAKEFATMEVFEIAVAELKAAIADLNSKVEKYGEKFATQSEAVMKAVDLVEAIAELPSAEPVKKEEVKMSKKDAQMANIVKIAQSLKK
jgi:hypothetical protein